MYKFCGKLRCCDYLVDSSQRSHQVMKIARPTTTLRSAHRRVKSSLTFASRLARAVRESELVSWKGNQNDSRTINEIYPCF